LSAKSRQFTLPRMIYACGWLQEGTQGFMHHGTIEEPVRWVSMVTTASNVFVSVRGFVFTRYNGEMSNALKYKG
jgi:hypothetical protein